MSAFLYLLSIPWYRLFLVPQKPSSGRPQLGRVTEKTPKGAPEYPITAPSAETLLVNQWRCREVVARRHLLVREAIVFVS